MLTEGCRTRWSRVTYDRPDYPLESLPPRTPICRSALESTRRGLMFGVRVMARP
jgi:hypothetical protein